jgi:prepilin-type N-terminal cleavage/methylation domain-containing protein
MFPPERNFRRRRRRPAKQLDSAAARPPAGGFTLLELLVAVAVLGTVLALVFGAFSQITRGAASLRSQLEEEQQIRLLTSLVADELAGARFLRTLAEDDIPTGLVAELEHSPRGEFTRIDFHAAVPARFHRQGTPESDPNLHEIGYRVRESPDRNSVELVRREDFYLDNDLLASRGDGIEAPLAREVVAFKVEFLPWPVEGQTSTLEEWEGAWDSGQREPGDELPRAMRLTLSLKGKNGRTLSETLDVNLPKLVGPGTGGDGSSQGGDPGKPPKDQQ